MGKFDTHAKTTYLVKLAMDAKAFPQKSGEGEDVVLTFVDESRIEGMETLWVDARVAKFQAERAKGYLKGDIVQVEGKLRFKLQKDGTMRGKIYDAVVNSFVRLSDRNEAPAPAPETSRPAFE